MFTSARGDPKFSGREPTGPGCLPQFTYGTCSSSTHLSLEDILYYMESEVSNEEEKSMENLKKWKSWC